MSIPSMAHSLSWLVAVGAFSTELARAQCPGFSPSLGTPGGGVGGVAYAQAVFDDGTGPKLFVAGGFETAGNVPVSDIARWDGSHWSSLGSGLGTPGNGATAYSLAAYDDGTGPALVVGGAFSSAGGVPASDIAKWNGTTWSPVGPGLDGFYVYALSVFDDGTGPALYAGGELTDAGGLPLHNIGKWNGSSWSPVGSGLSVVHSLHAYDDGNGSKLYAGCDTGLFRWDGVSWSAVGGGPLGTVESMTTYDDGSGPALYVGGVFDSVGGMPAGSIARWDGASWSLLSGGLGIGGTNNYPEVKALAVYDAGTGPRLHVAGRFTSAAGAPANNLAVWDGASWSAIDGVNSYAAYSLAVFDSGTGPMLHVGASVESIALPASVGIARWDGAHWIRMQVGNSQGIDGSLRALATYDDGGGPAVYAGGQFVDAAGDAIVAGVAKWDGTSWSALGAGVQGFVYAMTEFDDGSGPALYVGGGLVSAGGTACGNVVRWNGQSWSLVGPPGSLPPEVDALCVYNDGQGAKLYAGGQFGGGWAVWDPSLGWTVPPGASISGEVYSMAVHETASGSRLVVGGHFSSPMQGIAEWNGTSLSALGCGLGYPNLNDHVWALTTCDFGSGPEIVAGGNFHWANCVPSSNVVRWDGSNWTSLTNLAGNVKSLARYDDGNGPALYAGGAFALGVVRWSGASWSSLGNSTEDGPGFALLAADDTANGGSHLFVASTLRTASLASFGIAEWMGCPAPGTKFCFGDGNVASCPCANEGAPRHGCENSHSTGGAELYADGGIQPDTVVLRATGELTHALSVFLQGSADVGPFLYGDGLRCAGGTLRRLYIKSAVGGFVSAPQAGDLSITARSAQLGDPIAPGSTRYYQTYYRDPNPSFCPNPPGNTWNTTNGVVITW